MPTLSELNIDYAFLPCDGKFTMKPKTAEKAATMIKAKNVIPYHTTGAVAPFNEKVANKFNPDNKLVIKPDEEIILVHK